MIDRLAQQLFEQEAKRYPKGCQDDLSDNFRVKEFECPCPGCTETLVHPLLVKYLEEVRLRVDKPLLIHSGYRCAAHQASLRAQGLETAAGHSTHEQGWAADFSVPGFSGVELAMTARFVGFKAVGTAKNWIHCDLRGQEPGGRDRRWSYST